MEKQKPRGYWTLERCMEDAKQYRTRSEWQNKSPSARSIASRKGWAEQCCAHMTEGYNPRGHWTLERCAEEALRYRSKKEWERASISSYSTAHKKGWLDQCCEHMEPSTWATANDVVYVWHDAGTDVHKIGITSARIGEGRVGICSGKHGMDPRIVFMLKVGDARAVEKQLLELGTDPELDSSIDGYTEFRELTNDDLREAVGIAYRAALKEVNHARS
jgi:hypothetical protein